MAGASGNVLVLPLSLNLVSWVTPHCLRHLTPIRSSGPLKCLLCTISTTLALLDQEHSLFWGNQPSTLFAICLRQAAGAAVVELGSVRWAGTGSAAVGGHVPAFSPLLQGETVC